MVVRQSFLAHVLDHMEGLGGIMVQAMLRGDMVCIIKADFPYGVSRLLFESGVHTDGLPCPCENSFCSNTKQVLRSYFEASPDIFFFGSRFLDEKGKP